MRRSAPFWHFPPRRGLANLWDRLNPRSGSATRVLIRASARESGGGLVVNRQGLLRVANDTIPFDDI